MSATGHIVPTWMRDRSRMAATSAPRGYYFPAPRNLSSTCRPGSIPTPIRFPGWSRRRSGACRSRPRSAGCGRWRREPTARHRPRTWSRRRARRCCCPTSPPWCRPGVPRCGGRPIPSMLRVARLVGHAVTEVADVEQLEGCRPRYRHQSEQSGWTHRRQGRAARRCRGAAARRRAADGRRSLHGCRSCRREPRRPSRTRQHRGAALVRQVLRAGRAAARLRAGRTGDRGATGCVAWTVGGSGTGNCDRRDCLGRPRVGGGDARAARAGKRRASTRF